MKTGLAALPIALLLGACGAAPAATRPPDDGASVSAPPAIVGLGPFRLGMSAVELRIACADSDGLDWSPNQHAFTRGCEVEIEEAGITFQRFEMRLDGPSGRLIHIRAHAEDADELSVRRAFPGAEVAAVDELVLVTISAGTTPAPVAAARPPE